MGIEASYRRVTREEWRRLNDDPEYARDYFGCAFDEEDDAAIDAYFEALESSDRYLDIHKDWQAIHFLLTGELADVGKSGIPPPLVNVVMGGTETPWEATYGQVRSLNPEEVRAVAEVLSQISEEDLAARLDPEAFNRAKVYPDPWPGGWDHESLELLLPVYSQLAAFFEAASQQGDFVLLSLD